MFFSYSADTQYLILLSQLVIFFGVKEKTQVSTSPMGAISGFFSIISGFGSMQVHNQCQHFLSDESFLSSVMHFLFRFDSLFCRDSSADCEVVRFSLPLPLLPYVQAFFSSIFHYLFHNEYTELGLLCVCSLLTSICSITKCFFFCLFVWTEIVAFRAFFAISWPVKMKLLPRLSAE